MYNLFNQRRDGDGHGQQEGGAKGKQWKKLAKPSTHTHTHLLTTCAMLVHRHAHMTAGSQAGWQAGRQLAAGSKINTTCTHTHTDIHTHWNELHIAVSVPMPVCICICICIYKVKKFLGSAKFLASLSRSLLSFLSLSHSLCLCLCLCVHNRADTIILIDTPVL